MNSKDYKKLSKELDDILDRIQDSAVEVDEVLELYARGAEIIKEMKDYLDKAENKVRQINIDFDNK